ncbi:lactosylceramide 4-alpha-galactosyltransferase [Latimeria chalumnae]|uniref:Alpha 1,4-glycosyltransferase domain-containing protein n=1 Tax=Latimeria chalumnae TaxID=7897 RepID=H2ZVN8_LATCH|nr:PREDICTED: lactosylceramide 4-alpha-galactosyltransferase-like [Latimeria chalumnae]XP_006012257.1 PREDICTED: lactosylceramide 4-alpha-galactosyltransferase-like [Latimeria chalumnae]|eukprot:XP_006012256.1 PREDICTED: lactosylceramide 4-alpha-galactosyltransferase-like [Latimeria chalumnae]
MKPRLKWMVLFFLCCTVGLYFLSVIFGLPVGCCATLEGGNDPVYDNVRPGIMFVETTDAVELTPLTVCAVESAARVYPTRPVNFFLRGFQGNASQYTSPRYLTIPILSSIKNIHIYPLKLEILFHRTPLLNWFKSVRPFWQRYWTLVLSDASRLAMLWKFGGIYLDTDIISIRAIPVTNFLCAEGPQSANGAALGFEDHHNFIWDCMVDFVCHFNGNVFGNQGPKLVSRILKKWCGTQHLGDVIDKQCGGVSYLSSRRFYPIPYFNWTRYFESWEAEQVEAFFSQTYGAHVWNFMNTKQQMKVEAGTGALLEELFRIFCPSTYQIMIKKRRV